MFDLNRVILVNVFTLCIIVCPISFFFNILLPSLVMRKHMLVLVATFALMPFVMPVVLFLSDGPDFYQL